MRMLPRRVRAHPWLAGGVAVVVLAGGSSAGYFLTRNDKAAAATTTTTQTVATGTVRESVSATGTLAPASEENLNFSVSGEVTKVAVSEGQHVKKGQTLATIDSASLQATVAQAESTVASDEARVDDDSSNDASDTQVAADKAALTAAKNQLASAKSQLASATMTSPINGVVAAVNLTVGESVSGNAASNPNGSSDSSSNDNSSSDPQILVISTNSWLVNATVDATSVGLIKKGNQAQLTVTGASDTVYGTISSIGLVSSSTSGTASYPVVIDVTGSPSGLHDGANVTATLIYKQVKNGKTVQTTVRVGIASGGQTQIVSGLSAGDKIIVPQVTLGRGGAGNNGTGNIPRGGFTFPGGGKIPAGGGPS